MDDFALTPAERALFDALNERGVPFILIGMGAAVLEGAPVATQDLDLWFESIADERIREAARQAGGFWISGFGMQPPSFGGDGLDRLDVVLTAHGLEDFRREYARAIEIEIDGARIRILPLDRVIASKRSTNRLKDQATLPVLEATLLAKHRNERCPPFLFHVSKKEKWSSIQKGGLDPEEQSGRDADLISAFGFESRPDAHDLVELKNAVANSKIRIRADFQEERLSPDEFMVLEIMNTCETIRWQPSEQKIELKGEILDDLFERLTYWQTSQIVPPEHLRRLDE